MYQQLAKFYDMPLRVLLAERTVTETFGLLKAREVKKPGLILDLGCGTGEIALGLARDAWQVLGLDASEGMLALAQEKLDWEKAGNTDISAEFRKGDIRDFTLESPVAAALAYGDLLNHLLTADEVRACLKATFQALAPGGWLFIDLNALDTYRSLLWNTPPIRDDSLDENGKTVMTISATFDEASGRGRIVTRLDVQTDEGLETTEEILNEQYYPDDAIRAWLTEAGFTHIENAPFNPIADVTASIPGLKTLKTLWQCQKPLI